MKRAAFLFLLLLAACNGTPAYDAVAEEASIRHVIADMEAAWNRGDFRGYMAGFKNPDVVFVSGGKFQQGWQGTLDHYIRDYGGFAGRRGDLHLYNNKGDLLPAHAAMLLGPDPPGGGPPRTR